MERKVEVEKAINFIFSRRNLREMSIGVGVVCGLCGYASGDVAGVALENL